MQVRPDFFMDCGVPSDNNLETPRREELAQPQGPITRENLRMQDKLDAHAAGIESLLGMEHAVNLTCLDINFNQISDLSPLEALPNLA